MNDIDSQLPYVLGENPFKLKTWKYLNNNLVESSFIAKYLTGQKRTTFCKCTDGCANPKKCACYKYNNNLINPTYDRKFFEEENTIVVKQTRT